MTESYHGKTVFARSNPHLGEEDASPPELVGLAGEYRLVFAGSPVLALTGDGINVGAARVRQTEEALTYQYTDVIYGPGQVPLLREVRHQLLTRPGQFSTIVTIPFLVPERGAIRLFFECQRDADATLGALTLMLDERIADRRVGDIVVVPLPGGKQAFMDVTARVRSFQPDLEAQYPPTDFLSQLAQRDLSGDEQLHSALRLYLRAIENRLTQDGYILLSAAVDDLCGGRNKMKPHDMRAALEAAGQTPAMNTLERVSSVRGRLIHNGMVDLADLYTAWYDLEEITRVLLRHRAELDGGWPTRVPMYEGPLLAEPRIADVQQKQSQTEPPAQSVLQVLNDIGQAQEL